MITLLFAVQAVSADTVALSLADAVDRAQRANYAVVAARAEARAAAQSTRDATRAFLPSLTFEAQGVRTTDPVAVFGMKLRQEEFQGSDLDLDPLNRPDPYGNFTLRATVQQPLFSPEGLFGYSAARRSTAAQRAASRRTAGAAVFDVVRAYWGVQLSVQRVRTLDEAIAAARAHADQAQALRDQGVVTGLDARLARIRAAELDAQRLRALADAENARRGLAVMLAFEDSRIPSLTDSLASFVPAPCGDGVCAGDRGDLSAARYATEAAQAGVRRAWAMHLPSLVAFGDVARHSRQSPFSGGSGDWTIGIALVWKPFQALSGIGAVERARAERAAFDARRRAATEHAALEQAQARRNLQAAEGRVLVTERAQAEAREALTQAELRYRTGVSPISELLDVRAALTNVTLSHLFARHDLLVAHAALEFAYGVHDQ